MLSAMSRSLLQASLHLSMSLVEEMVALGGGSRCGVRLVLAVLAICGVVESSFVRLVVL